MLKFLRNKKTAKKIWIALAAIIVPAFALWGSSSLIGNRQETAPAGMIFGKKVSLLEYKDALAAVRNQALIRFGDDFSQAQKYLNLEAQAWVRLLLLSEAKRREICASDREVIEAIEGYPFFDRNGSFNNRIYSEMLQYVFHTPPRAFEEQVRQDLIIGKLFNEVTSSVKASADQVRAEYRKTNEELSLYYIAGISSDFAKDIPVADDELKNYFAKNSLDFKLPLSFNLDYITCDSEEKIKKAYLYLRAKDGMQKVSGELGLTLKETGLFSQTGPIPGIGWSSQIMDMIMGLGTGRYSAPVRLDNSYYIFRIKERKEPYVPAFEAIKAQVREAYVKNKSRELALSKIEDCSKQLNQAYKDNPATVDFDKAARSTGLKSGSTAMFKYGSYIENIGASDDFFEAAKGLKIQEPSPVLNLPSGFYIIKVKSIKPIDEKKFSTEFEEFSKKILLQKKQEYFNDFVEGLKRKA